MSAEFEKYKAGHSTEYQFKKGMLLLSTSIFIASLVSLVFGFGFKILRETSFLNILGIISTASFVILPILLIRFKTFEGWREALGHRVMVSWSKILWAILQTIVLIGVVVAVDLKKIIPVGYKVSDYHAFIILIVFFSIYKFLAGKLRFLSPASLRENFLPFSLLSEAMRKKIYSLMGLYLFFIFAFGLIYYLLGEAGFRPADKDSLVGFWDYIYFSAITITSTGYGDVAPVGIGRLFSSAESIVGNLYIPLSFAVLLGGMIRKEADEPLSAP